ncbi:MAG: amino acid adenylation domain-containing protein [Candidatus Tectomicrobia bacterium]|nr:amino acid adenylation domain-containing protein [Candidatus Tectomicrobia bacterium]
MSEAFDQTGQQPHHKAKSAPSVCPLSYGQQALWYTHQLAPDSPAYNTAFVTRITSPVQVPVLRQAWQALLHRHAALRTTFTLRDGDPAQEVHASQAIDFVQVDASSCSDSELTERVRETYQQTFDLEQGPLYRVRVFTQTPHHHILLFVAHHIVIDAWSQWRLLEELRLLYPALLAKKAATLPPLPRPFHDYVRWQADMLQSKGERLWGYWREQLAGVPPQLNLPTDWPRPPMQTFNGASEPVRLPTDLSQRLRALASETSATLYQLLLSAFAVLLHRYSGQDDLLVGSPAAGRTRSEFTGTVGDFVDMLVLRANRVGNPPFRAFLRQMRQTVLQALLHQDYPFRLLVERMRPRRDPSYSPLFQVAFIMDRPPRELAPLLLEDAERRVEWGGLELAPFEMGQQEAQFDLDLLMIDGGDTLFGFLRYNTDLFDAGTMQRMARHFLTLLEAIVTDPDQPVDTLPILTSAERRQLLMEWNATQTAYPDDTGIHQVFEAQVESTPEAVAVVFEDASLTYSELNRRANQLAHYLQALGVGPETLVGLCMERSLELVVGLLGILKAGGAYVPLDPTYPTERLTFMMEDTHVSILLTQHDMTPRLPEHRAHQLCLDTDWEVIAQSPQQNPQSGVSSTNLAYVIYTSGSTGKPKGAMNTHRGICNRLFWMQDAYPLDPTDGVLQKTPFSFDVSVWEFFWPLLVGSRLIVARPGGHQDPAYLVRLITRQRITTLHFVPPMLQVFLEGAEVESCRSIQRVICSGEALSTELQRRFFSRLHTELHNLYGPTEAAIDVSYWACQPDSALATVPIGWPVANTCLYIVDGAMQPVPVGVPGELLIGGVQVARGYYRRPGLTGDKFVPNPFGEGCLYKTGDLVRYLSDGAIEFLGRMDTQVKLRGFRIELGEIESVLAQHPSVREAAVVVRDEANDDRRLIAYVIGPDEREPEVAELRHFLQDKLPDYMVPAVFVTLDELPLTPNGKLNRRALPDPSRTRIDTAYAEPQNHAEHTIAAVWQEVLHRDKVGIDDNFFDLGGHSLLVMRVCNKLQDVFSRDLSVLDLFRYPTISALAQYLDQEQNTETVSFQHLQDRAQKQKEALTQRRRRMQRRPNMHG